MLKYKEPPLSSCKNPLWVAAFFFNKLKKAQIMGTDISSAVDKIMNHEMDGVSYRILAYLLLGVIKTYSKKVEYLLHDCNNVRNEINKFVINRKNNAPVEAARMTFIMPATFELDALDLGELEDTSGYHIAPPEQITLKEVLSNTGGFGFAQFSQERFEDFDMQFEGFGFGETSCSLDRSLEQIMAENSILQFQPMDFEYEVFPTISRNNLIEGSPEKQLELQKEVSFEEGISSANDIIEGSSEEQLEFQKEVSFEEEISSANNLIEGSSEKPSEFQKKVSFEEGISSANNLIEGSSEKQFEFKKKVSFEERISKANPSESTIINETPQSKFHGDSIARPKRAAAKSDLMLIPTPDAIDRAHFSKKRKFIIDEGMTILPNEILRKRINDASKLVSVRRPLHMSLIDKQKKAQMFNLLKRFNESLFPCHSPKLQRLLSNRKLEIPDSLEIGSDVPEAEAVGNPESIQQFGETLGEFEAVESQPCDSLEHTATAPETPPLGPSSPHRIIEREQPSESSDNTEEEEISSCETETSEMTVWSERTRKVATNLRNQMEAGSVNLSKVSEGRTRKESARLFYEILVLKTTNYVDVKQKEAYGDIEVRKLPKFDKKFGV